MAKSFPLEIAARAYYWKPMAALFTSLQLQQYHQSGVVLPGPVLDLGCGDGRFIRMLREIGVLKGDSIGFDISVGELHKARKADPYKKFLQADANHLPFNDDTFASITCNGVLCSIPQSVEQPLREIHRVLKPEGLCVITVPTDHFIDVLILPELLGRLSSTLRSLYITHLNNRLPHFHVYPWQQWAEKVEKSGLTILERRLFFSARAGHSWNMLALQMFRAFGLLSLTDNRQIVRAASVLWGKLFGRLYMEELAEQPEHGYLFLIAQKHT